ncbi:MAG: PEFG-CTERM sorting domain-containing protein [Nitrososphaerales archaeon]
MSGMLYAKCFVAAVLVASIISIVPNVAYSQAAALTVKVDKTSYGAGEEVMISGTVPAVLEGVPVAIQVFNPRNTMYTIDQVTPNADGTYSTTVKIGGKLGISGIYTVKATYSGQSVQATFEFTGGEAVTEPGTIRVEFEGNVFNVKASLSNGNIQSVEVDPDFTSIILFISTSETEDGELLITLPRDLIDSRINGDDDDYILLVDGEEADFEETETTSTSRTLVIPIPAGAEEVEIIGTVVVPEFGILAALVLVVAVGAIIAVSRKNQILKLLPQ